MLSSYLDRQSWLEERCYMGFKDELINEMKTLKDQIAEAQKVVIGLERKYDGIRNLLLSYAPKTVAEPERVIASERTARSTVLADISLFTKGKYVNSTMWEAISDILDSKPNKYFIAREIHDALIEGGKKMKSDDTRQIVNVALYKYKQRKSIKSRKVGKKRGYQIYER